jgi:hypothetical protein
MITATAPKTHPAPERARGRVPRAGVEPHREPAPSREEPPSDRRPNPFLVVLLRALSAWHA